MFACFLEREQEQEQERINVTIRTRQIYHSANGDRWLLAVRSSGSVDLQLAGISYNFGERHMAHRDGTGWLGREDSNLCILESDPLLSIMT
jgi:hypothetical protein